jgi:hypothetical protein
VLKTFLCYLLIAFSVISCVETFSWKKTLFDLENEARVKTVCIDANENKKTEIIQAFSIWNNSISNWTRFEIDEGFSDCDVLVTEVEEIEVPYEVSNVLAWVPDLGTQIIYLVRGKYEKDPTGIIMHEIGHMLGAQHVEGTLMNSTYDKILYSCPDKFTVAQIAAWNKINLSILSWCTR